MRIDILTLFPGMLEGFLKESIIKRAIQNELVSVNLIDFREFSDSKHKKVDDYPYGSGAGMVLNVQPVVDALKSIKGFEKALKIMMTPQGYTFNHKKAYELSNEEHIIILCGHYEGFDERIRDYFDIEISIGDYVLTGGEIGALVLVDSITRLIPDVINKDESHINDSFNNDLLEHPHYTRPREYDGKEVPEVLVNGNHKLIDEWRLKESIKRTKERRPDLYKKYNFVIFPSILIFLVLLFYLFFGLERPETTTVYTLNSITQEQSLYEEKFLEEYDLEEHNELNPFVVLDPYNISPLTALLVFETNAERQFKIVIEGLEEEGNLECTSQASTMHYIPVYGLYSNHINKIHLYDVTMTEILVTTIEIETEPLPEEVTLPSVVTTTHDYFGDDLMLVIPALKSYPMAVDYNGDVRWYLTKNLPWSPDILDNGRLLLGSDRLMSDPYYVTGLYEMDFLGKVYREYKIPGGYHHDVVELPNDNLLVLSSDFDGTVEDLIVEIDRNTGEVIESWDLKGFLNTFDGMSAMWTTSDWFHNNSIDYNEATDEILLSGRHQDAVISIDKTKKELNYIIGDPENWSTNFVNQYFFTPVGEEFEWQYAQHSAMFLPNGDIFLFDNNAK